MNTIEKKQFKWDLEDKLLSLYVEPIEKASDEQIFIALSAVIKDYIAHDWANMKKKPNQEKQVYYFSIEFLLGKQLHANLLYLGIDQMVKEVIEELGFNFTSIKNVEVQSALGNGGLGRLAACFLDSMAALGINGHGCGIRYKYGLFKQRFINGFQVEMPDYWLKNEAYPWEVQRPKEAVIVKMGGRIELKEEQGRLTIRHYDYIPIMAMPYDIPMIGYKNKKINTLRLWSAEVPNESFQKDLIDARNSALSYELALKEKTEIESISHALYPDDSKDEGRTLRLKQEYFLVSAGIQTIINQYKKTKGSLHELYKKVAIHINDTHPALCVPELMRLLMDEEGFAWDEAWDITQKTISYTNHTMMNEALERWSIDLFKSLLPRMYMIIEEINKRWVNELRSKAYPQEWIDQVAILYNHQVNMANLSILGSYSVNGVAKLHTTLLKQELFPIFNHLQPNKFNNKTNGIVHRRWLILSNPRLSGLITDLLGDSWQKDPIKLNELRQFKDDLSVIEAIDAIKEKNKADLAQLIYQKNNIRIDVNSIFDVQVKRLHGYKRQLMNALHILHLYHQLLENPQMDFHPRTFIFGAKAAPSYHFAKSVIKFIHSIANQINNDPIVNHRIKVVFIENYNVSLAETIIPATNVSEQISTATKEASGTSNMKMMMNGAITLATMDGANIEIFEQIGKENMVTFGLTPEAVLELNKNQNYLSYDLYQSNPYIKQVIDSLTSGFIPDLGKVGRELYDALITYNDEFFVLKDFEDYRLAQLKIEHLYNDRKQWNQMALLNIAVRIMSSDRTIKEYQDEIWFKNK